MSRIPLSARVMPRTRARLRDLRTDVSGQILALRPVAAPGPFHTANTANVAGVGKVSRAAGSRKGAGSKPKPTSKPAVRTPEDIANVVGDAMLAGWFSRYGQAFDAPPERMWTTPLPSVRFAEWIHGFGWLDDLVQAGGGAANEGPGTRGHSRARTLVDGWIAEYGRHHGFAWQPVIVATRLQNWLRIWSPALNTDHLSDACAERRRSAARQARFLRANLRRLPAGAERIRGGVVLALYGLRLPGDAGTRWRDRGFAVLTRELSEQVLADGGHISRSPATTLDVLGWLRDLDALLDARGIASPSAVARAMDRMEPMMAFFAHTDGGLAGFHGSGEGDIARITSILGDDPARPFAFAPQSKYHRLSRGPTTIIADVGAPPPFPHDADAHLSALAFEMSVGAGRLVVNCAWSPEQPTTWREPVRATSAHSTLALDEWSAGKLAEADAGVAALMGGRPVLRAPTRVRAARKEAEQGVLMEGEHDGYAKPTGLLHSRRLFLSESGEDLRGEDALDLPVGETPVFQDTQDYTVRFHIHPDVDVHMGSDGRHVRLVFKAGREWVFLSGLDPETQKLDVEPSAYLGTGNAPRPCSQIVLRGRVVPGERASLRWAFRTRSAIEAKAADSAAETETDEDGTKDDPS